MVSVSVLAKKDVKFSLSFVFGQNYITTFGPVSVSAKFINMSSGQFLITELIQADRRLVRGLII